METVRNKNNKDIDKNLQQPKGHKDVEEKEDTNQQYKHHREQEQIQHQQEDHWQIQRRKNNNQMQAPRGNNSQTDQSTKQTPPGLEVRDQHKGNNSNSITQTSVQKHQEQGDQIRNTATNLGKDTTNKQLQVDIIPTPSTGNNKGKEVFKGQVVTGIDSMLPSHNPTDNVVTIIAEEVVGGLDGKGQETQTNLQEWVSKKGEELTHVIYEEVAFDHRRDSRAPATPTTDQQKSGTP
ncbi:hypothetical protein KY290_027469 [Solanum tuberosum]|uniref:Bifunctional endo-1,4-beta-xylanase xylA n=1 Tax=Solanum tuberosum TaxID=4113 RepID=A0ABQ7UGW2_SOLTU|nr:hypothetical protein KY290_027469 [Solanum tuberosum]